MSKSIGIRPITRPLERGITRCIFCATPVTVGYSKPNGSDRECSDLKACRERILDSVINIEQNLRALKSRYEYE